MSPLWQTLTEDPSTYKNLNDIDVSPTHEAWSSSRLRLCFSCQNAATSISMVIAESRAEDLLNHSRGLGRVAQAMRDLQFYLGGVQDTQFVLGRLKAQVPSALGKYRQHLLDVLSRCKTAGLQPDEELLFALSMYACTCAQTVSDAMRERATSIVVAGDIGNEGVGVYALFASFLSHERADVLFALKAGVLAFEMSLL